MAPHFLFNTLSNLYALTLLKSDHAPEVVLKLSALLRYMLYECNAPQVPLDKEVRMMQDYVELEKLRYGDRLDLAVNVQGDLAGKGVAPLLLLPFLENAFKHGASEQLDQAWIALDLMVKGNLLKMNLINSVSEEAPPPVPDAAASACKTCANGWNCSTPAATNSKSSAKPKPLSSPSQSPFGWRPQTGGRETGGLWQPVPVLRTTNT